MNTVFQKNGIDLLSICLMIIVWIVMAILVNPIGDFPLNDDWAYGWTVKTLLETGRFQLSDWTATNLLPQALWGTLFCLPFGFSFTALRFSTLVLGLVGVIFTYGLFREAGASAKISLLGSLVVALNPIYFVLSNSFNSDVPSFAFFIASLYFLVRGVRLNSRVAIIAGLIFSFIAILNRQSSLILLPAFSITYLIDRGLTLKTFVKALAPTLAGIVIYVAYSHWLDSTGRTPLLYGFQIEKLIETLSGGPKAVVFTYAENIWILSIYLGLFLFPFLVLQFSELFKTFSMRQKRFSFYLTLFLVAIGAYLVLKRIQMPLMGNTLNKLSLGPVALEGFNSFLKEHRYLRILIRMSWALFTLIGLMGASILFQYVWLTLQNLVQRKSQSRQIWLTVFLFTTSVLYFLPIGGINKNFWFDRYIILLLPLWMVLIFILTNGSFNRTNNDSLNRTDVKPRFLLFFLMMILCVGTFTVSATHDYLSWNRVRWFALDNLMKESQVSPSQIGGRFEFNGWYFGNRIETCNPAVQRNSKITNGWETFSCLWNDTDREYTISFVPKPGYQQQATYSFRRWLPWKKEVLYVLHKHE